MVSKPDWTEDLLQGAVPLKDEGFKDEGWTDSLLPESPKSVESPKPESKQSQTDNSFLNKSPFTNTVQGRIFREFMMPGSESDLTKPTIDTEKVKQGITESLVGYKELAQNPVGLLRGSADFLMSLPGFAVGIANAAGNIVTKIANWRSGDTLEDLYSAASEGMNSTQKEWKNKVVNPVLNPWLGKESKGSEMVGLTVMAPALAISEAAKSISDWPRFEDSPNIRGALKFTGDIGGLVALGKLYSGGSVDASVKVRDVADKAIKLKTEQDAIDAMPDSAIKIAQQKIADARKAQLELQAKEVMDNLDYGKAIKEDLTNTGGRIQKIKQANKYIADEVINKAFEKLPEAKKEETPQRTVVAEPTGQEMFGEPLYEVTQSDNPAEIGSTITRKWTQDKPGVNLELRDKVEPDTDLDMEIQEREPFQLDTEHSPFRESAETTKGRAELYNKVKWQEDPELATGKVINDVNHWLDTGEGDIGLARDSLSQFASRAEELRDYFRESEDYPSNFDNWKEMVSEAASWARRAKRPNESGTKLYDIGGAVGEGAKEIVRGAKRARDYIIQARGMKSFKPLQAAKMLKEELTRSFVDRSGNIRKGILENVGDFGYEILQRLYLAKGASSRAAAELKQMQKEVYRGLDKNEKRILDSLIFHNRMVDIGKYKTPKQFTFFKYHPLEDSIAYIELLGDLEKLSPEEVADMHNRAAAYFEWMKRPLKDMKDSGIISEQEYNDLSSHNYRKLKLVDIFDKRYQGKLGKQKVSVYDSGIQSLARGKQTDIFEPSSEVMALEVFNRAYGRIYKNEANKNLLELARRDKENPFVRVKENKNDSIPSGWDRIFVYENGERKPIYLSSELSKEWITNNPEMSYRLSQLIRYASGSQILRTFATGINWGFALANVPRDVMHIWFAARSWENGKWKPIYSPHAPVYALQIGRDLGSVFTDALLRKGRYKDYINEGGGMEFLVHQGRILQRGRHLEGPLDKVENFLGFFGETSEILTRLAIRERALRQGKSRQEATFIARDYMDFGQGGGIAKALDNGVPYLNASIQGMRGFIRALKENPMESSYKLAQFGAAVTGTYIASMNYAKQTQEELKNSIDSQNNFCIPLPDDFRFTDNEGQEHGIYLKIPLDQNERFFKKFFEAATDKWLGNEIDVDGTVNALEQVSPVGVSSLPPTISGTLGYVTNKDFWKNSDIWKGSDPFSYPNSAQEYDKDTPQAFIQAGKLTGLSPERLKYAVGELVANGTIWSYLAGAGYDELLGDLPKRNKEQHLAMVLSQMPVAKRFIGVTNPYSKYGEKLNKAQEDAVLKEFVENRNFDIKVDAYLYGEGIERKDLEKEARQYKDKDTYDRLMDRLKFEEAIKTLPEKSFWRRMKGLRLEAKAKVFADRLRSGDEQDRQRLWKEYGIVAKTKGIISPEFRAEVRKQLEGK